ncbi:hypothetical protein HM131_19690 [Halobacillus mangrovi]|uniref:Uncharacterized protein n=1 Tax=Halobacillus mangrovi TaxID=402384 RepID=A0A1W6A077_9BACI|nr:hypothetical protein HM131_19690 [Halobacillus mangrovi]
MRLLREWNGWQGPKESIANEEACRHLRGESEPFPRTPILAQGHGNGPSKNMQLSQIQVEE